MCGHKCAAVVCLKMRLSEKMSTKKKICAIVLFCMSVYASIVCCIL